MEEITKSISESIKRRAVSATFGTYIFFWLTYHWQGVYTTLFVNQEFIYKKYGLLKNEYASQYFFGWHNLNDWGFYFGLIVPGILTFIFIWVLPDLVLIHLYKKEQKHKVDKRIIKINEEKRITSSEEKLAIQQDKTLKARIQVSDRKKQAVKKDPKIAYDEEFDEITKKNQLAKLRDILVCVYRFKGNVVYQGNGFLNSPEYELDPNSLRFGDSRDILKIVNNGSRIELTEKGKYFASKYPGNF